MKTTLVEQPALRLITSRSESFPEGNATAFAKLEDELDTLRGRRFYALIYASETGLDYHAALLSIDAAEEEKFREKGFPSIDVPGGSFARAKMKDWRERTREIGPAFGEIIAKHGIDRSRPQMEFYRSLDELHLLVPIPLASRMRDDFLSLAYLLDVPQRTAEVLFERLEKQYGEPHRHYHTLSHIDSLLRGLRERTGYTKEIELAIWFHDVIYDPRSSTNEVDSAAFFATELGAFLNHEMISKTSDLILATQHGLETPKSRSARLLCDLDLEILAAEPFVYQAYRDAIRLEYSHVPDVDYAKGRSAFLQGMLTLPIYQSESFQVLESRARANLEKEIQFLDEARGLRE